MRSRTSPASKPSLSSRSSTGEPPCSPQKAVHWAAACMSGGRANQGAAPPLAAAVAIDSAVASSAPAIAET